jgi:hypothetical protein
MAKEVSNMVLDDSEIFNATPLIPVDKDEEEPKVTRKPKKQIMEDNEELISCLKNERVIVRFVPKQTGLVSNPKHILYGGMAEAAVRWFTLPRLTSGMFVNPLTDREKAYLEEIMGLEYNALSIYKKIDNYWDNFTVRLTKQDNFLDLSNPDDYIKYKILLANKDYIASSLQEWQDKPKMTYQFVIIQEGEETKNAKKEMNATMQSYMKFGGIQDNPDKLRVIIETIDGRPLAKTTKLEFLQEKINKLIQADPKLFLRVTEDPYLDTKVLIKKAIEGGLISNRGGMLYLKSDGTPLCGDNEEPTLSIAAKFLSTPKRQDLKFSLEAKLKE